MKFFLLAHLGMLVVLVAGTCEFEQLQNNLTAFNVRLTSANTSGARPSSVEFTSLCRELLAKDGIFRKCSSSKKGKISSLKNVKTKLKDYCNRGCNGYLDLTECIKDVDGTDNNGTANCNRYFKLLRGCVSKTQWCELRDDLFLTSLPAGFRESLHEAGCVPRPATVEVSDASNSLQTTSDLPASTVTSSLPVASATAAVTWQPAGLCNLITARSCVGQIQERLDAYDYEKSLDALVPVCIASVKGDRLYECYHNNTVGCDPDNQELMNVKAMMEKADNDSKAICQTAVQCTLDPVQPPASTTCTQ